MNFESVTLEQFAEVAIFADPVDAQAEVDPRDAYMEGYAAGHAAALEGLASAERAFTQAAQSLNDALTELKPSSERALNEALETLFAALLPALTNMGFAQEAAAAAAHAFAGKSTVRATIAVHPDQAEALAAALSQISDAPAFDIAPDEKATAASARVVCGKGGMDFDLAAAAEACLAALSAASGAMNSGS